ncbi:MAG: DUF2254 domain-containing protein [Lewinellaceae bacterium]|nr:DUF2254 domain-containing protein [Lewinellaceae bacterium]
MSLKIRYFFSRLQSSFWFVPGLILLSSIGLAVLFLYLDYNFPFRPGGILKIIFSEDPASGRTVLSIIAGAMAGIAGTVFSITLVVLQLASSQLGPRLLQNFMYKRINQVVLGQYIGLFLYSILVLNALEENGRGGFIPNFSILFAIVFAVFNVFLLVIYIHNISTSIQPSKIIYELRLEIEESITKLYPDTNENNPGTASPSDSIGLPHVKTIFAHRSGYIQYYDLDALIRFAGKEEAAIKINEKPGAYIVKQQPVFEIFAGRNIEIDAEAERRLQGNYQLFRKKSFFQDTEFAIQQIVEIASKALSPGINDPNTAINCIDNLTSALCLLVNAYIPDATVKDDNGRVLIMANNNSFEGYLKASFDQIRQFGASSPSVIIRMMESIITIFELDKTKKHRETLKNYAELVWETGEKVFTLSSDIEDLRRRYTIMSEK